MKNLINFVLFQAGWFICVVWQGWFAILITAAALLIHFKFFAKPGEWQFIGSAALLGTALDSILSFSGVFQFPEVIGFIPPWLMALWFLFPLVINHSLNWLSGNILLSAAAGAFGGSLSYYAGYRLGSVSFPMGESTTMIILAFTWAVFFPFLFRLSANILSTR